MNAAELVAALRAEHHTPEGWDHCASWCTDCPCPPAVAADRIEATLAVLSDRQYVMGSGAAVDALDGAS